MKQKHCDTLTGLQQMAESLHDALRDAKKKFTQRAHTDLVMSEQLVDVVCDLIRAAADEGTPTTSEALKRF